jgi:hypothetical protein
LIVLDTIRCVLVASGVPGDPAQPMTRSDVIEKFARCARRDARAAAGILDAGPDVPFSKALEELG